jgi:hypothetical protein
MLAISISTLRRCWIGCPNGTRSTGRAPMTGRRTLSLYDGLTLIGTVEEQPDVSWAIYDANGDLIGHYDSIKAATAALRAARSAA